MSAPVNYFEVGGPDAGALRSFYAGLFDWTFGEASPQGYQSVGSDQGGLWDTSAIGGQSWAIFYVMVDDVHATLARAAELGATVLIPFTDGGGIEFAHLADPNGQRFGVWRPKGPDSGA